MDDIKIHTIDLQFLSTSNGIAAFLVESPQGPILVETGPHSTFLTLKGEIERIGYQLTDIKHVLITHIHLDHAGAAWCFAEHGAQIYLHPRGYKHMHDPSRLLASAKMIYQDQMDSLWGTLKPIPEDQLHIVQHLDTIEINGLNFIAHHTPGHAQHHIAWQLGPSIFTGDVAGVSINDGPVIPPCPPPDIDREAWLDSIDHLLSLNGIERYYLAHFGPVRNVIDHMDKLKIAILAYTEFIEPYAAQGKQVDDILPDFRLFVKDFLIKNGLNADDATAYEAANPSDMSATGLLRYWNKKEKK